MNLANSFIGVGWRWPIELDAMGAVAMVSGTTDLEQSMQLILATTPGERPMRPEFGCHLSEFVFAPGNAATASLLAAEVLASLTRWEPRVEVGEVSVDTDPADTSLLWIDIEYTVRSTNDRRNLVVPFYAIPDDGIERIGAPTEVSVP